MQIDWTFKEGIRIYRKLGYLICTLTSTAVPLLALYRIP